MLIGTHELIVDNFAGGGGASLGIELALGRSPDIAINHDPEAITMHKANHPTTEHYCQSIYQVDPDDIIRKHKKPIGFAWFSPDCTHHSKARGGKPKQKHIRDLAWVIVHWAERAVYKGQRIKRICVENVEEFIDWGDLLDDGQPDPEQKGMEFRRWLSAMKRLGYVYEYRVLHAHHYGAPTIRKRLVIIFRCDGEAIGWPEPTHGEGRAFPYRTAAECIDWSIPCPSIFERKKPLAENTMRRIARGVKRYVIDAAEPFIVNITHTGSDRIEPLSEPMRTITSANRGEKALITPFVTKFNTGSTGQSLRAPLHTITAGGNSARPAGAPHGFGLVAPMLSPYYGEKRPGEARGARCDAPLHTQPTKNRFALVAAFLAQHNSERDGRVKAGRSVEEPFSTITASGSHQSLVASSLIKFKGTCKDGQSMNTPLATIQAQGMHHGEVRAFLMKYYGTNQNPSLNFPLHTVTSKDRFGLVTVYGEDYIIVDIGMRMLAPRELYRAQGFDEGYIIDPIYNGKPMTKTAQVRMCGNSVSPPMAQAVTIAQFLTFEPERIAL